MEQSSSLSIFDSRKEERLNSGLSDQVSVRTFNTVMLLTLLWGFGVNALMVAYFTMPILRLLSGISYTWVLIGYFVFALGGVFISAKSTNPWISFLGYNLLVMPIGVVLCDAAGDTGGHCHQGPIAYRIGYGNDDAVGIGTPPIVPWIGTHVVDSLGCRNIGRAGGNFPIPLYGVCF